MRSVEQIYKQHGADVYKPGEMVKTYIYVPVHFIVPDLKLGFVKIYPLVGRCLPGKG